MLIICLCLLVAGAFCGWKWKDQIDWAVQKIQFWK